MGLDRRRIAVVTATSIEARAARRELPDVRIYEAGMALAKRRNGFGAVVISCGVAGCLGADTPTGSVLIPREVLRPDGSTLVCDAELVAALAGAARSLGFEPLLAPLVTSSSLIRGPERAVWAARGYAGVDMETGLLDAPQIAAVRVVLDTPQRELRADWLRPARAMLDPRNWAEARWLAREAPRCARRAAAVVAAACS